MQALTSDLALRLQSFPDVLECKAPDHLNGIGKSLHFAPASLLHLLQTPKGHAMMSRIRTPTNASELDQMYSSKWVKYGKIPKLYVVVPAEPGQAQNNLASPLIHGRIQPLSVEAVQEMLAVYVCRHPNQSLNPSQDSGGLPSAMHVFPDHSIVKNDTPGKRLLSIYTTIQNPSIYSTMSFIQQADQSLKNGSDVALEETEKVPRPHFASTFDDSWDDYNDQIRSAGSSHDVNAATSSQQNPRRKGGSADVDPRVAYLFVQYEITKRGDDSPGSASRAAATQHMLARSHSSQKLLGPPAFGKLLLPNMCWWRACLSPACDERQGHAVEEKPNAKKGQLIERTCWHCSNLKGFLDAQSKPNAQSEAQRSPRQQLYCPRRRHHPFRGNLSPPPTCHRLDSFLLVCCCCCCSKRTTLALSRGWKRPWNT